MNIENLKWQNIDTQCPEFLEFENSMFRILENSYDVFYGNKYHKVRMTEGNANIYLAYDNEGLVGLSYIKKSNGKYKKRGGTVVFPPAYRRKGIATQLVRNSLIDIPNQYTILSIGSEMLSIVQKIGFKRANTIDEIKEIVGEEEFKLFSNFRQKYYYLVFDRKSI